MKKQKKQSLLTTIIIILVLALIVMVGSIIYEEKINMSKNQTQNTVTPTVKEENINDEEQLSVKDDNTESEEIVEDEIKDSEEEEKDEEKEEKVEDSEQYVGEEENDKKEDSTQSKEEQAIDAVKKQWGEDDSVTFSVERKKDTKYYVAVKSSNSETTWYEVDIETWEVEEY